MAVGKFCLSGRGTPKLYSLLIHRLPRLTLPSLLPPVPISSHKTDSTLVTAKTKPRPPKADILDSSHPQHRWNFSHNPTIASQTTALMNGRPSEFTSQVNRAQFHCPNLLFLPSRRVLRLAAAHGSCQFGHLSIMLTLSRPPSPFGALIGNSPWLT